MTNKPAIQEDISVPDRATRKSFCNLGFTFSGLNLLDLAKEQGNISADTKHPVYEYPFGFIGWKYGVISAKDEDGEIKEIETVSFKDATGQIFYTTGKVIIKQMKEAFEQSKYVKKDDDNYFVLDEAGYYQTIEEIQPVFTYYEKKGNYQGYAVLN